jgi:hypothetical protein
MICWPAHKHLAAAAYAVHALPFEIFLPAMLLEEHKEVIRLRRQVEGLGIQGEQGGMLNQPQNLVSYHL